MPIALLESYVHMLPRLRARESLDAFILAAAAAGRAKPETVRGLVRSWSRAAELTPAKRASSPDEVRRTFRQWGVRMVREPSKVSA